MAPESAFDRVDVAALRGRSSEKWVAYPPDVLPAHIAEMDFALAPEIEQALLRAISGGDLGYAAVGPSGLAEAFAAFAGRRFGWEVDPAGVAAVPDVMVGVAELLRLLTPPGAGVVVNTPVYPPFFSVLAEVGREVVEVPLLAPEAGPRLPLGGIREAFERGAAAMLLCNPHNPTGYVARREELVELAAIVEEHGALVLADEIHAPLVLGDAVHVPFCSVSGSAIALHSATKAWNFAGLKCGLAVAGSARMREALATLPPDVHDRVGHLGVIGSVAAYTQGEPWLDELRRYVADTHRALHGVLAERLPGVRYHPAEATYLAWLDCRELGLADDPAAHFLEHGRVALVPGPHFGAPGRGFARLNVGTSRAVVEEAVNRIASSLGEER